MRYKSAIITGASRGIGKAIALKMSSDGYRVVINYTRNEAAAYELVRTIEDAGGSAEAFRADVGNIDEAHQLIEFALTKFDAIDLLVNNAGITRDNLLSMMDPSDLSEVLRVNLLGTMYCTQAVCRSMMRQKSGTIINLSSVAASKPGKGQSNYAAAKGGVEAFTKAMAVELAPKNIRVNAVSPGVIETDMSETVRTMGQDEIMKRLLLKRYGQADEVAAAVHYLASESAAYITGEVLHLNGGLKMA